MGPRDLCMLGQFSATEPPPCPGFCSWLSILSSLTLGMRLGAELAYMDGFKVKRETRQNQRRREVFAMGGVAKHLQRRAGLSPEDHT